MASKQTSRKSTGGLHVPRKQLVPKVCMVYNNTKQLVDSIAFVGKEEQGNASSRGSGDGGGSSQKQGNSKRKLVKTEIENAKITKNQIAENSYSAFWIKDADGCNLRKLRMTWTH